VKLVETNAEVAIMDATDVAWVAGFFEGEGSFVVGRGGSGRKYLHLRLGSTDKDVLDRLQSLAGGRVIGPRRKQALHHKDFWVWGISSHADAVALSHEILPYLGERRRRQFDKAMAALADQPALPSAEDRFWALVKKDERCWHWQGFTDRFGFGTWTGAPGLKRVQAHRYAIVLRDGRVPPRLRNTCGNKACVRPEHWTRDCKTACLTARDEA
jgi:hypothetical protein